MTKNVLVTISGLHYDDSVMMVQEENSNEANSIEVTTPATYYLKNGKHYIVYDEIVEGIPGTIKNRIKIDEGRLLDITKSGITNSHMVFEIDKINVTPYQTPYGDLLLGTYTKGMDIQIEDLIVYPYCIIIRISRLPFTRTIIRQSSLFN